MTLRRRLFHRTLCTGMAVLAIITLGGCTGARPHLVEPPAPTPTPVYDPAAIAAADPTAPASIKPLRPMAEDAPGEPTEEDAITVWSLEVGLQYRGQCASPATVAAAPPVDTVCSTQIEDSHVYYVGPSSIEHWYVVKVGGEETAHRVTDVYVTGS